MAKKKIKAVIDYFICQLKEHDVNVSQIILFGSHRAGTATADSDIDLVVVSKDFRKKNIFQRVDLLKKAEINTIKKYMLPLDVIALTPEEYSKQTSLVAEYAHKGKILYAA
jgi:predicted nucleotidyltransferase